MASDSQNRKSEAIALDALVKTASRIAKRLPGVEAPDIPTRHRYPEMLPLIRMEALAGFLDQLDQRLKDEGYSAMAEPKDTEQPVDATDAEPLTQPATPEPAQPELPQTEPEAPSGDDAPQSDEDAAYKDEAQSEVVEPVKTKAKR